MSRAKPKQRQRKKTRPAGGDAPPVTTPLQKLLLAGFGLGALALGLVAVELVLALAGVGDRRHDDPFVGFEPTHELFTETLDGTGRRLYATSPGKLAVFNHQEFPLHKPAGVTRVFTLGGSTTFGRPYDAAVAFGRFLELYANAADPSRRFEVINAGGVSYASYRIVVLMRELVRYEPDIFVIYTGHNEFLEERTYSALLHADPWLRRLGAWLSRWRLAGLLTGRSSRPAPSPGDAPVTLLESEVKTRLETWTGLDAYTRDDALRRSILAHFEFNLRRMIEIAGDHGVEVVFVLPISNLAGFSPFKSELALTGADAERFERRLAAAREALDDSRAGDALGTLRDLLGLDPEHAELHYRLGQAHLALGETAAAHAAFVRAKDLDVAPLRAPEAILQTLRQVTAEAGVATLDLPALLERQNVERFGHPILGNEVLIDHVHPHIPVHGLIAERLLDMFAEAGWLRPTAWSEARRRELHDGVMAGLDRRYYAERDLNLAKVLGWSGKLAEAEPPLLRAAEVLGDHFEVRLNLGILYQKTERPRQALPELRRAVELDPSSSIAFFNLGVVHAQLGQIDAAIAALEEADQLAGEHPEARHNLEVLRREQAELEASTAELRRALEASPGAEAPGDATAWNDLGIREARRGDIEAAIRALRRAVELDPSLARAHFNLGVALDQSGDPHAAIAAIDRALELEPANPTFRRARALIVEAIGQGSSQTPR